MSEIIPTLTTKRKYSGGLEYFHRILVNQILQLVVRINQTPSNNQNFKEIQNLILFY